MPTSCTAASAIEGLRLGSLDVAGTIRVKINEDRAADSVC